MNYDSVYESVEQCNKIYGGRAKSLNMKCVCGEDLWTTKWGVKEIYRSQYNPGEYCLFTCVKCGHSIEEQS